MSGRNEDKFAHEKLRDFIRLPLEQELVFDCPTGEGVKIVKRMRVKLSKLRGKAIKQRRTPRPFKMYVISTEISLDNPKMETITLKKTESSITGMLDQLQEIEIEFEGLAYAGSEV